MDLLWKTLLAVSWAVLFIIIPGGALAFCLGAKPERPASSLFLALGLGTVLQPVLGIVLDLSVGISSVSLIASFVALSGVLFAIGLWRRTRIQTVSNARQLLHGPWKSGKGLIAILGLVTVGVIAAVNWSSAIGVHAADMGWHLFWARTIITTGHLPNYLSVEPFDQAAKFTFGAHFILAEFHLVTGLSIMEFFWVPLVAFSIFELIGLFAFAESVTRSQLAGIAAAAIIAGAFLTGGYIQRGNFPDILGYFVCIFAFWLLISIRKFDWRVLTLGLAFVAVLEFHQNAAVVIGLTTLVWIANMLVLRRRTSLEILREVFTGRLQAAFWVVTFLAIAIMAARSTYLNGSGVSLLTTGTWAAFIPSFDESIQLVGFPLVLLGVAGIVAAGLGRAQSDLVVLSWVLSLVFLANSPRFGMNFESQRFMWRLPEPLALCAVLGISFYARKAITINLGQRVRSQLSRLRLWQLARLRNLSGPGTILGLAALIIIPVAGLGSLSATSRYAVQEPYFGDGVFVAEWLRANGDPSKYVIVNVDRDGTGTWIMSQAMLPHFLFRVDFGTYVAPVPYRQVYADLRTLYSDPGSPTVTSIIQTYNIGYVVVNSPDDASFLQSPYFGPVFLAGSAMVFVPVP